MRNETKIPKKILFPVARHDRNACFSDPIKIIYRNAKEFFKGRISTMCDVFLTFENISKEEDR